MLSIQETTQIDSHTRQGSILATFLDLNIATSKKTYDATLDAVRYTIFNDTYSAVHRAVFNATLDVTMEETL